MPSTDISLAFFDGRILKYSMSESSATKLFK